MTFDMFENHIEIVFRVAQNEPVIFIVFKGGNS
jgi:hypothetical protein